MAEEGLFPALLRANREKKDKDLHTEVLKWSTVLDNPYADDASRQAALDNIATLYGPELGVPKAQHGFLGNLIGAMHTHLSSLNPAPGNKWEKPGVLKQLPGAAPAIPGKEVSAQDDPIGLGYRTPDMPGYHPFNLRAKERREQEETARGTQQQIAADTATAESQRQIAEKGKDFQLARLKKRLDAGEITPQQHQIGVMEIETGAKSAAGFGAGAAGTLQPVNLVSPDGTKTPVLWNPKLNTFVDADNNPVEAPPGSRVEKVATPAADRTSPRFITLKRAYKAQHPNATDAASEEYAAGQIEQEEQNTLTQGGLRIARTGQDIGVTQFETGIGPGAVPKAPGAAPSGAQGAQGGQGAPPSTPAPRVASTGTPKAAPPTPQATPKAPGAAAPSPAAASAAAEPGKWKQVSPVAIQNLRQSDPLVNRYINSVEGNITLTGKMKDGAMQGLQRLQDITHLPPEDIQVELTNRKGVQDGVKYQQGRRLGLQAAANQTDNMGKLLIAARNRVKGDHAQFIQRVINNYNNQVNEPDTIALTTALQGWVSSYGKAITGGQMSNAQIPIAALADAEKMMNTAMDAPSDAAVVVQAHNELEGEKKAIADSIRSGSKELQQPFGSFAHPEWAEKSDSNGSGGGKPTGPIRTAEDLDRKYQ